MRFDFPRRASVRSTVRLAAFLAAFLAVGALAAPQLGAQDVVGVPSISDSTTRYVGVLRPGDILKVFVFREKELTGDYPINSRGQLQIPGLGIIQVAGLDPVQAEHRLRETMIARGYSAPEIAVLPQVRVSVLGEVRTPALYPVDPGTSLLQIITIAGGPTERADLRKTRIVREGRSFTVDLESALAGAASGRIVLYSNDYVVIPQKTGLTRENLAFALSGAGVLLSLANIIVTLTR